MEVCLQNENENFGETPIDFSTYSPFISIRNLPEIILKNTAKLRDLGLLLNRVCSAYSVDKNGLEPGITTSFSL